jgi:3-oxoacyl-[acyl-carrier-protein] synthase III
MNSIITWLGYYQPKQIVTNDDIADLYVSRWFCENSSEGRNGIVDKSSRNWFFQRRRANENEDTRTMAFESVKNIVDRYWTHILENLDAIYLGTFTPSYAFPSTAALVAKDIEEIFNIEFSGQTFDILTACPSALNAMDIADSQIKSWKMNKVMIIWSDKMTWLGWYNQWEAYGEKTLLLFWDAAGSLILEWSETLHWIQWTLSKTWPQQFSDVFCATSMAANVDKEIMNKFIVDGGKVYTHGVRYVWELVTEYISRNGLHINDFDYIVPHQANKRMLDEIWNKLDYNNDNILKTLHENGNTGAASPLLTLSKYSDKFKQGDRILLFSLWSWFTVTLIDYICWDEFK